MKQPLLLGIESGPHSAVLHRPAVSRSGPRTAVGAPGYLSVRRAAEILGIRPRSVIDLVARGCLTSQRLGRVHFISTAEVERYRRERRARAVRARSRRVKLVRSEVDQSSNAALAHGF